MARFPVWLPCQLKQRWLEGVSMTSLARAGSRPDKPVEGNKKARREEPAGFYCSLLLRL